MDENTLLAFAFTLLAGLSTGIGSAIAFFANRTNTRFLAASLGCSATTSPKSADGISTS